MVAFPDPSEYAPYFQKYIELVSGDDALAALQSQIRQTAAVLLGVREAQAGFRYAPGKWSVREVVGHLSDTERIFAYRAMRFARADTTLLAGFDESAYIPPSGFDRRTLADLTAEFIVVRSATLALFGGLEAEAWSRRGVANNKEVSVRALAWIIAGHERHHLNILRERYLATSSR